MSAINPAVRHSVSEFLKSIEGIKLGECEPDHVIERRKMMAVSVAAFVIHGNQENLTLGDMVVSELAGATMALCEKPRDRAAIDAFIAARDRYNEVQESLGG